MREQIEKVTAFVSILNPPNQKIIDSVSNKF